MNVAKLTLIFSGLFLAFVFRLKSHWLFALGLMVLASVGFFILTKHQGAAQELSIALFFLMGVALFRYLVEIKKDEK